MAKLIGRELPEDALRLLKPEAMESKRNKAVQIITVNPSGWPDAGMLSYADVIARDKKTLHLATWGDGECARDLRANGKSILLVIDRNMAYYIKGMAVEVKNRTPVTDLNQEGGESPLAFFAIEVGEVYEDRVPTAQVVSGVTFVGSEIEDKAHQQILKQLLEI